jgi:hypothetical protein
MSSVARRNLHVQSRDRKGGDAPRLPRIRSLTVAARISTVAARISGTRRGSIYVAVLGVATFVAVVGLSALLAVRVQQIAASLNEAAVQADYYSQSTIDLAMYWIAADANWRTTYTNDTWTGEWADGPLRFNFKLVDELDGDLANDPTQPVRLYGRATSGSALRMYSVELQPRAITNVLSNGEMENATVNWTGVNCTLESRTDAPHGGTKYIYVDIGGISGVGPFQVIPGAVESGATYQFEIWVAATSGTLWARPVMEIYVSGSSKQSIVGSTATIGATWTKLTGTFTPTWSGTLTEARICLYSVVGLHDFKIDDALLYKPLTGPALAPVRGTWRREVSTIEMVDPDPV